MFYFERTNKTPGINHPRSKKIKSIHTLDKNCKNKLKISKPKGKTNKSIILNHRWLLIIKDLLPQVNALHCYHSHYNYKILKSNIQNLLTHKGEKGCLEHLKMVRVFIQR